MLINANSLQIPLADNSVQCVVTSPPYYGLRDYGTAKWEGGDPGCSHKQYLRGHNPDVSLLQISSQGTHQYSYRDKCKLCGAVRIDSQIGLEQTPEAYIENLVNVFRGVYRILKKDGTLWLNIGDSYAGNMSRASNGGRAGYGTPREGTFNRGGDGLKPKDLIGIPWMLAFALRADGWYLRQDIIWHKPNPMPESVKDRCTKAHEYIFLITKSNRYYFDYEAIMEEATGYDGRKDTKNKGSKKYTEGVMPDGKPNSFANSPHERWQYKNLQPDGQQPNTMHLKRLEGDEYMSPVRRKRSVWTFPPSPFKGAHFAVFPPALVEPCVLAGSRVGDIVFDPFVGSGTTVLVAQNHGRIGIGTDLNLDYLSKIAKGRVTEPVRIPKKTRKQRPEPEQLSFL